MQKLNANQIYHQFLKRNFVDMGKAIEAGMIPLAQLEDGVWYQGHCRNSSVAKWNQAKGVFLYIRKKFGDEFEEEIDHPENDQGFDIFVPVEKIENKETLQNG